MKNLKLKVLIISSTFLLWGCSGNAPSNPSGTPTAAATSAAPTADNHLMILPFKVTMSTDKGVVSEMTAAEDGEVIVLNKETEEENVAGTFGNGTLQLEDLGIAVKLAPDGSVTVDDKPSKMKISDDGVLSMDGKEILKREGDKIVEVDASLGLLKKDGAPITVAVEGDAKANRFIMLSMGSFMFVAVQDNSAEPADAPAETATPAPTATP